MDADFWSNPNEAQKTIRRLNAMKEVVDAYDALDSQLSSLQENDEVLKEDFDEEIFELHEMEYNEMMEAFEQFELKVLLSHEYDHSNAIIELHPGAGGTESCDWASMLYRMYSRWAADKGFKVSVLDYQAGDEAGIKSVTMLVEGDLAYGYLKCEKGVHRLVRLSPFDSNNRRHTSFASIEVTPEIEQDSTIEIDEKDLKIDTFRSSGAGGQHINTTDSAVRITHMPTGIVVQCQSERSQIQNRATCMKMLTSKLVELKIKEHEEEMAALQGEQQDIGWGSQIRSYVFHPYSMAKDHRTSIEKGNIQAVMDGDIQDFIQGYLKQQAAKAVLKKED